MKIGENSKSEQINNQLSVSEQQSSSKMKIKNTSHQTISLGNTAFASIREANSFYIDKTDFIRQWWESQDVATLITRPRRFGKSLNLNMLECFFSEKYRGEGELFRGLSIWNHEKYREIQGTYPVIFRRHKRADFYLRPGGNLSGNSGFICRIWIFKGK